MKYFKQASLWSLLIVPFALQLVGTVALVGYLSFRSEQDTADRWVDQWMAEVNDRVAQKLQTYVETPARINRINAEAVRLGELNLKDLDALKPYFLSQLQQAEVSSIQFGNPQGSFRVAQVLPGAVQVLERDQKGLTKITTYRTSSTGQTDKRVDTIDFLKRDARDQPWYGATLGLEKAAQASVFLLTSEGSSLYSTYPIYEGQKLSGAFAVTLQLDSVGKLLGQLKISQSGQVFVIDRAGSLIGSSTQEKNTQPQEKSNGKTDLAQVSLIHSSNLIAREIGAELEKLSNLYKIDQTQRLDFVSNQKRYFAEVTPLRDRSGLDWLVVTVLPSSDLTLDLQKNIQITIRVCLLALISSLGLSTLTATWIARPLRRLRQAAQAIAAGNLEQETKVDTGIQELQGMSNAFNQMTQQLHRSFQNVQANLIETEEKYATIFRNSPDPIFIITVNDRRWVDANDSFLDQSGYIREELVGRFTKEVNLFTNSRETVGLFRQVQKTGAVRNQELKWQTKAGELRTSLVSCEKIELSGQTCLLFISKDVSELKATATALRERDRQFQLAVQYAPDMFVIYDRDRRIQYVNDRGLEKVGWRLEELIGQRDEDLFDSEITNSYLPILQRALDTKTLQVGECTLQLPGLDVETSIVKYVPLLNDVGEIDRVFGITYDITSRKRAENALRDSEKQMRLLADSLPVVISYVDAEKRYQFANKTYETFFGINRDSILGKHLIEVLGEDYYRQIQGYLEQVFAGETVAFESTLPGEQSRDLSVVLTPNLDENSQVKGYYVLAIDISDRRRVEQALQRSQEAAEAASCAKSVFLSSMSHELRTPLNAILGFAQLLQQEGSLNRSQQNQVSTILRSGEHLLALINDVLEMSKIDAGRMNLNLEDFDLHEFLEDLKSMLRQKAEVKGLQFQLDRADNLPRLIQSDKVKLRQILINLLGNAIKFTQDGWVALRVRVNSEVTVSPTDTPLIFEVEDTGIGIMETELERIFEPFVQSELRLGLHQGTGLGLALSRRYARLLEGEVTVSSSDRGSVFRLEIAAHTGKASAPKVLRRRVVGLASQQGCRLLVAEDQPDSRQLVVLLLSNLGFEVREACNGQEAIDLWQSWSPQVILMDMQMPVLNGYETTRQIRALEQQRRDAGLELTSPIPIIALTASVFEEQRAEILAAGCNAVISKPFQVELLYETIGRCAGKQYIYEQEVEAPTIEAEIPAAVDLMPLQRSDLEVMPIAWRRELHHAATRLFEHKCQELVALIPTEQVHLRQQIDQLIQEFRFDRLIELTRES